MAMAPTMLTVSESAAYLGVTTGRVRALIREKKVPAIRVGPILMVAKTELARYKRWKPGPGRPRS